MDEKLPPCGRERHKRLEWLLMWAFVAGNSSGVFWTLTTAHPPSKLEAIMVGVMSFFALGVYLGVIKLDKPKKAPKEAPKEAPKA